MRKHSTHRPKPQQRILASHIQASHPYEENLRELTLAERPERIHAVWSPLEKMLAEMESTGEVDAERGKPVFFEEEHRGWYEVAPALQGLIEVHALAAQRYGKEIDLEPLRKLSKKFDCGAPVFPEDLAKVRTCISNCKRMDGSLTVTQAVDLIQTIQIHNALNGNWKQKRN
jgi:hypothetical protein